MVRVDQENCGIKLVIKLKPTSTNMKAATATEDAKCVKYGS